MRDIVEQLRAAARPWRWGKGWSADTDAMLTAAADEIERLRSPDPIHEEMARALEPSTAGWLPISTAPEKTDVIVYIPSAKRRPVRVGRYGLKADGKPLWSYGGEFAFDVGVATKWQPLPPAPSKASEHQSGEALRPLGASGNLLARSLTSAPLPPDPSSERLRGLEEAAKRLERLEITGPWPGGVMPGHVVKAACVDAIRALIQDKRNPPTLAGGGQGE